ncbi:unnamed protein product [Sphagnum compactum]
MCPHIPHCARIGSYIGIVTDIPMPGQLVELNKQAWLLLTHYNVSQLHGLRVGAMVESVEPLGSFASLTSGHPLKLKQPFSKLKSKFTATLRSMYALLVWDRVSLHASVTFFYRGLAWGTDEGAIRDAFSSFGEVTEVKIICDRDTGRSRGFGFVSFKSEAEAAAALQEMDGRDLGGRTVRVDYAVERAPGDRPAVARISPTSEVSSTHRLLGATQGYQQLKGTLY